MSRADLLTNMRLISKVKTTVRRIHLTSSLIHNDVSDSSRIKSSSTKHLLANFLLIEAKLAHTYTGSSMKTHMKKNATQNRGVNFRKVTEWGVKYDHLEQSVQLMAVQEKRWRRFSPCHQLRRYLNASVVSQT